MFLTKIMEVGFFNNDGKLSFSPFFFMVFVNYDGLFFLLILLVLCY